MYPWLFSEKMLELLKRKSESPVAVPCSLCSVGKVVQEQKCVRFLHQHEQLGK